MATMSKKIVVLDDSEICREIVRVALEARGHTVISLDSPFGLTRLMNEQRPDLVLVDVMMPALSGDKVAGVLLKYREHTCPVVFLSDRPSTELRSLVEKTSAAGFIRKTNDLSDLADQVEQYLT
jgi:DNA-binding response OmpR family regulator